MGKNRPAGRPGAARRLPAVPTAQHRTAQHPGETVTASVAQALSAVAHAAAPQSRPAPRPASLPASRITPRPVRGETAGPCPCAHPDVLADRPDGTVVRHGERRRQLHAPDTDAAALTARITAAADPLLAGILLPPLPVPAAGSTFTAMLHGRPLSLWPYGAPVDPEAPEAAPWEDAATLLARLHAVAPGALRLPTPLPPMRGPAKAGRPTRACGPRAPTPPRPPCSAPGPGCRPGPATEAPPPHGRAAFCHGDLHLGQLVRHPAPGGPWLLIDVDDMGTGDPAWDLARPAAWYAAGLLAPDVWDRFLGSYRAAGGTAVCPDGDPWPQLDVPARALTAQTAALALAKSAAENRPLDEVEEMMIEACVRIAALPPELASATTP